MDVLSGADVATFLGKPLRGPSLEISHPADLGECDPGSLVWIREATAARLEFLDRGRPSLVICTSEAGERIEQPRIITPRPRLDFVLAITQFFKPPRVVGIDRTAIIESGAKIGKNARIGAYVRIGPQVCIGDDCDISSGVSIEGRVFIGNRCIIKSNSVLGDQGFGFAYDENGVPRHFPHLGKLILEDDVWIGACTHVGLATLGTTRIGQGTKIDDLVQFGHNCKVGPNTLIMAHAVLCGGAEVGASCWIAPNSVIKEKVRLGDRVTVGLGAVVLHDVEAGMVVVGVPAKPIKPGRTRNE